MKKKPLSFLSLGTVLLVLGCSPSCRISPQNVPAEVVSATESAEKLSSFVLKEEFWVYRYSKPIATFTNGGEDVVYRMTAASGGALGGWLGGMERDFWGILPAESRVTVVGVTRRKEEACYLVRVDETEESEFKEALIEIYGGGGTNYSGSDADGMPRLNEAYFQVLEESA